MKYVLLDFLVSMKWLWVFVLTAAIYFVRRFIIVLEQKNRIRENELLNAIKIDDTGLVLLDELIQSTLEEYQILQLTSKQVLYISNALEKEILQYMQETVPDKISPYLIGKLGYMYNSEYVGALIGTRIYLAVLDFVLNFNVEGKPMVEEKNK